MWRVLFFGLALTGCDDTLFGSGGGSSGGDTSGGYSSGYTGVVQIFNDNCISCHTGTSFGDLDLSQDPCANLVDVTSFGYAPAVRVVPSDSANSVLWNKMAATDVDGESMPLGSALDSSIVGVVKDWIDSGAACGGDTSAVSNDSGSGY